MHFTALEDSNALAEWLAIYVANALSDAIKNKGRASLAVSGGSTPKRFFKHLSQKDIEWDKVWITLVDERWVPPSSSRSNQRMITLELLQGHAAKAKFIPLFRDGISQLDVSDIEADISPLLPFDVIILGMGTDGHTASLFPSGDNLALATSDNCDALVLPMNAPDIEEPRVTLTLPVITGACELLLHIEGEGKREILEKAVEAVDPAKLPISFVLQKCPELRVVWAS